MALGGLGGCIQAGLCVGTGCLTDITLDPLCWSQSSAQPASCVRIDSRRSIKRCHHQVGVNWLVLASAKAMSLVTISFSDENYKFSDEGVATLNAFGSNAFGGLPMLCWPNAGQVK